MRDKSILLTNTLRNLLAGQGVKTQEDIKQALQELGIEANQSQISRYLHKIGAVKTKNESGKVVYQLPKEPPPATTHTLAHLIIDVVYNEMLIIVHTSPGSASLIARTLDHQQQRLAILGTVAGDDTILVIPKSIHQIKESVAAIKALLTHLD